MKVNQPAIESGVTPYLNSMRVMVLACLIHANEAISLNLITPLLTPMVEEFLTESHDKDYMEMNKGSYVSVLASAYFWSCTFSGIAWGVVADRFGRRIAILGGILLCTISNVVLAFSISFPMAVFSRIASGLNANLAINKAFVGDCTDANTQSRYFSNMMLCFGCGTISAMLTVKYLSGKVIEGYGSCPAFGPSIVCFLFSMCLLLLCVFLLPETNTKQGQCKQSVDKNASYSSSNTTLSQLFSADFYRQHYDEILTVIAYTLISMVLWGSEPLLPLITSEQRSQGGLGLSKAQVTNYLMVQAVSRTVFTFFYQNVVRCLGIIRTMQAGALLLLVFVPSIFLPTLVAASTGSQVLMFFVVCGRGFAQAICFTVIISLINNSTTMMSKGVVLGIAQSMGSFSRGGGQIVIGMAYDIGKQAGFYFFPFLVAGVVAAILLVVALLIPARLCAPKPELDAVQTAPELKSDDSLKATITES